MPNAPYCYDYPRPAVTVDLVVLGDGPRVLLIRRKHDPFAGQHALPGGFLDMDETSEQAARRELKEETGVSLDVPIAFLGAYDDPGRDPRGRTISLVYVVRLKGELPQAAGADDAEEASWEAVDAVGPLAFDHRKILDDALAWLARQPG